MSAEDRRASADFVTKALPVVKGAAGYLQAGAQIPSKHSPSIDDDERGQYVDSDGGGAPAPAREGHACSLPLFRARPSP